MNEQSQHIEEESSISTRMNELISNQKKLEFLAHHFDPADFPSKNKMISDLLSEFHLISDNPFIITNKIQFNVLFSS